MFNFNKKRVSRSDDVLSKKEGSFSDLENVEGADDSFSSSKKLGVPSKEQLPEFKEFYADKNQHKENAQDEQETTNSQAFGGNESEKEELSAKAPEGEDDVSFEIPDFTEEDINLNINVDDLDEDSYKQKEDVVEDQTPESVVEEKESGDQGVVPEFQDEEQPRIPIFEESNDSEELPLFKEPETLKRAEPMSFNEKADFEQKDLPKFEVVEFEGSKFIYKHNYKNVILHVFSARDELKSLKQEILKSLQDDADSKKYSKEIAKNVSSLKEDLISMDKKIFM